MSQGPPPSAPGPPGGDVGPLHGLAAHEVVLLLGADAERGLTEAEVRRRAHQFGPNVLPQAKATGPALRLARQFHHPLIYVLLAAGIVTALLGEVVDSAVIFGVVLINAAIGFAQESRAQSALDALRRLVRTESQVRRDGAVHRVPSTELVPGDMVLLEAGDKVPADLRLLEVHELEVDESALTGESLPVPKDQVVLPAVTPVADRRNMVHSGTLVTRGTGVGITVATGAQTELGEIHRLVGAADPLATPLTRDLGRFSKVLTMAILALAAITFAVGVLRGESVADMLTAAVALAVGAIPEGLPAAVTITLAIGVNRMARRRAVIRRMPVVETLGSTTVVCTDKTGTLTENRMTVRFVWAAAVRFAVPGSGGPARGTVDPDLARAAVEHGALGWTLLAGALCNDARLTDVGHGVLGDPTEGALIVAARTAALDLERLAARYPRVAAVPFSSERQYMATLHDDIGPADRDHGDPVGRLVLVKGAVERVVALCGAAMAPDGTSRPLEDAVVLTAAEQLAGDGLRVLATATGRPSADAGLEDTIGARDLVLTGLLAMVDPPRPAAIAAVRACRTAGIEVKMITGDHAATATAIAGELDILTDRRPRDVLTGTDLAALSAQEYPDAVRTARVFARVSPEQKLRLVESLQASGEVVAMTGDGVNDAPALRRADIGIAMGRGGTEVAKDAADMVLTDDDFATIEAAIEEGRGVFDNLIKFITWTIPTNASEGLVILVAILLGTALPILPVQVLWINMTTAVALGLMLAFEPTEAGTMTRRPRAPHAPLIGGAIVRRIALVSALLVGGTWWLFTWELDDGATLEEARTAAVNLFVTVEAFYLFSCRSLHRPAWRLGVFTNRWIIGGVGVQAIAQLAITYLPAMNAVFDTAPIDASAWLRIVTLAVAVSIVVAVDKRLAASGVGRRPRREP